MGKQKVNFMLNLLPEKGSRATVVAIQFLLIVCKKKLDDCMTAVIRGEAPLAFISLRFKSVFLVITRRRKRRGWGSSYRHFYISSQEIARGDQGSF